MTIVIDATPPPCARAHGLYLDELLHSPPSRSQLTRDERDRLSSMRATAHRQCAGCIVLVECLYRAVVEVDVAGFVACTTERERRQLRRELGVVIDQSVSGEAGVPRSGSGPVSHESVVAMRQAHPADTCEQLATRLGCSTSTVKRHLRRARENRPATRRPTATRLPTVEQVLDAFDQLESSSVA